ncbi:MAG TPA: alkaline phosphatase family protein [Gemmatimonadales bacterium]|nr:alkaline phosphatase family protein [Gemmatimonadales bacterium]
MSKVAMLLALLGVPGAPRRTDPAPAPPKPKLVLVITVDQLRADYLTRWKPQLTSGFAVLDQGGAVFTSAYQDHGVTETAPGHAAILSGRWPAHTEVLTNVLGVSDSTAPLIGATGPGASPRRFRGTAFFDWLHAADTSSRALSVSRKDRGAILPIGQARQAVYWYAASSGIFTTSRYYADSLPTWVTAFNAQRLPFKMAGRRVTLLLPDSAYREPDSVPWENGGHGFTFPYALPSDSLKAAQQLPNFSLMDSLTLAFALTGMEALKLGRRSATDLLAVSLSTTDAIGHAFGPDSREIHEQVLRLDRYLGWFLDRVFDKVGKTNVVVVLTADHGVTPFIESSLRAGHAEARVVNIDTLLTAVNARLDTMSGDTTHRRWFEIDPGIVFLRDNGKLAARGFNVDSIVRALATRIRAVRGVARADLPGDLAQADTVADPTARRWLHTVPASSSVAVVVTLADWCAWGWPGVPETAVHDEPSESDTHVPLILWGKGVKPGHYTARANTVDIAPTLARLTGVSALSLLDGRVLVEALEP